MTEKLKFAATTLFIMAAIFGACWVFLQAPG